MKKKLIALLSVAALTAGLLTGCGSKGTDDKTIKIAASAVPHAEILEQAKPLLEAKGYTLEIQVFSDYVQPNMVVESGEFDANYFQHIPYLNSFNEEKGTHLVNAGGIHYEPFGLYPGKEKDLANIQGATIAVPNDTTNEARALLLLQDNGIIRNRRKILAAIQNAQVFLQLQEEFGSFRQYLLCFWDGTIIYDCHSTRSPLSDQLSADLSKRGMRFVGSTILHAFLQAIGIVNAHEAACFLYPIDIENQEETDEIP